MKNRNAFSLFEVVTAIVIITLLTAMAVPKFTMAIEKSYAGNASEILIEISGSQKRYHIDHDAYTDNISDLDIILRPVNHFESPVALNEISVGDVYLIASISRSDPGTPPDYVLRIWDNGTIECAGTALMPLDPVNICTRLGF
ncbi:MAG: type II secretion system protein [Candidatus Omnitrophota bacterium]